MKAIAVLATAIVVILLLVGLFLALWPSLRHQVTYPGGRLSPDEGDPARWGLPTAEQVWLETADGVRIHGWWIPAQGAAPAGRTARAGPEGMARAEPGDADGEPRAEPACGAVVYFHGNGNTIAPRAWIGRRLSRLGLDVLLFDYRGYGLSEGRPSEEGLRLDARAAWHHVIEERGIPPERLILFGHSLGSAVATELALDHPPGALVLSAPFTDFRALFRHHAPWLPVGLLPWGDGRYDAGSRIGDIDAPVLIALGTTDRLIPPRFSRAVYDAAPQPRRLIETPADHNTLVAHPDVWRALGALLRERLGCGGGGGGGGEGAVRQEGVPGSPDYLSGHVARHAHTPTPRPRSPATLPAPPASASAGSPPAPPPAPPRRAPGGRGRWLP